MHSAYPTDLSDGARSCWREPWLWLALLMALGLHGWRMGELPVSGEETRRGQIAREMLQTGDWLVPRVQGVPRMSRPPLQNWLIAITSRLLGHTSDDVSALAIRWPSVLATVLTVGLIYWYARARLSTTAAFASALAYATMAHTLEFGRLGETEALFTACVSASLLVWHRSVLIHGRATLWAWSLAGMFVAAGTLTKGIQAPVYFAGAVLLELARRRAWHWLREPGPYASLLSFFICWGSWQVPFLLERGWADGLEIYFFNVANRFEPRDWSHVVEHWLLYPMELFVGSLAPWSWLAIGLAWPTVWQRLGQRHEMVRYLLATSLFALMFVWLPPGSRTRYYMPLFPCMALLAGCVVDVALASDAAQARLLWRRWRLALTGVGLVAIPTLVIACGLLPERFGAWTSTTGAASLGGLAVASLGLMLLWRQREVSPLDAAMTITQPTWSVLLGVALLIGGLYDGPVLSMMAQRSERVADQVARLRDTHPELGHLVSFGQLHHGFLFHWPEAIALHQLPRDAAEVPPDAEYFAVHTYCAEVPPLPFDWEEVAVVSCDKVQRREPKDRVVIGRRLRGVEQTAHAVESPAPR